MILSFDGNVGVGKTTLIQALTIKSDFIAMDEHSAFLIPSPLHHEMSTRENARLLQSAYLEAEAERAGLMESEHDVLVDRSFVSMAAHVYSLYILSKIDIREWFLAEMLKRMQDAKVIIPDVYCFVTCDHDIIKARCRRDTCKGTDPLYYNDNYLKIIEKFNKEWSTKINGITLDTGSSEPIKLAEALIQQETLLRQGKHSVLYLNDCLRELLMRE